jgi:hypothetical protein
MGMQPGVLLMVCLLSLYLVAMVMFWDCLRGHKSDEPLGTEGRLTLRAGQTILGVVVLQMCTLQFHTGSPNS